MLPRMYILVYILTTIKEKSKKQRNHAATITDLEKEKGKKEINA